MNSSKLALCFLFAIPLPLVAAELKVVDASGLTRASAHLAGKQQVQLRVQKDVKTGGTLALRNIDGLRPEMRAECNRGTCIFNGVPDGTWLLATPGSGKDIIEVTILERSAQ